MMEPIRDPSLDTLLDLDGQVLVIDPAGRYWVKFVVQRVAPSPEKPHGLNYSLALHGKDGERPVGFDNAHLVRQSQGPAGRVLKAYDHKHRLRTIRPYEYQNAATLLVDSWTAVDAVLKENGVIP